MEGLEWCLFPCVCLPYGSTVPCLPGQVFLVCGFLARITALGGCVDAEFGAGVIAVHSRARGGCEAAEHSDSGWVQVEITPPLTFHPYRPVCRPLAGCLQEMTSLCVFIHLGCTMFACRAALPHPCAAAYFPGRHSHCQRRSGSTAESVP